MTEQLILVDHDDRVLGVGEKLQVHREGALHRAFSIFIFNSENQLLLQKRAQTKYHTAGLWSNTCCGHPRPGESILDAAHRRLKEEMNFDCTLQEIFKFKYRAELENNLIEHEYDYVVVGKFDTDPMPNPSEVEDWRWVNMNDLKKALSDNPSLYTYWLNVVVGLNSNLNRKLLSSLENT